MPKDVRVRVRFDAEITVKFSKKLCNEIMITLSEKKISIETFLAGMRRETSHLNLFRLGRSRFGGNTNGCV